MSLISQEGKWGKKTLRMMDESKCQIAKGKGLTLSKRVRKGEEALLRQKSKVRLKEFR